MDEYIKRKRSLLAAQEEHGSDTKSRIIDAVKHEFKGIGDGIRELVNKFNVLEQIVRKVGVLEEDSKNNELLGKPSSENTSVADILPDWQTPQSNSIVEECLQLGPTETMAHERGPIPNIGEESHPALKKLEQSSQIAERSRKIKKK